MINDAESGRITNLFHEALLLGPLEGVVCGFGIETNKQKTTFMF